MNAYCGTAHSMKFFMHCIQAYNVLFFGVIVFKLVFSCPRYELWIEDSQTFLMSAKKQSSSTTSQYLLSMLQNAEQIDKDQYYLGKVRGQ